jgi:LmbE family N-acetylglucosaminyl deacetylase
MTRRLAGLPPVKRVFAPLAVGGHVDHRLTHHAAVRVFGDRLACYEDFPYARKRRARWLALWRGGRPWGWRSESIALDDRALSRKCQAVACYTSQIGTLFGSSEAMERRIRDFSHGRGGERLWYPR